MTLPADYSPDVYLGHEFVVAECPDMGPLPDCEHVPADLDVPDVVHTDCAFCGDNDECAPIWNGEHYRPLCADCRDILGVA